MLYTRVLALSPVAVRLILGFLILGFYQAPTLARVAEGNDALSQFVTNYGCTKTKELLLSPVSKAMAVWADNVVGLDSLAYGDIDKDKVYAIINNGHVQQALNSLGDMVNFIAVAEEAAFGDPKKALRMASDWGMDYNVGLIAGPSGAAVWGVMKTLSKFAADLNQEILSLNVDMFGNYVIADPTLAGDNGGDIFLEKYLEWQSDEVHIAIGDNVRKMRGALIDYANIVLNQKDFPRVLDWKKPKYKNQLRVAARLMMKDAATIAEVVRKQNELKSKIPGLKNELAILEKFQHWYALLKGVTCTDGVIDDKLGPCLNGVKEALTLLPETEGISFQRNLDAIKSITQALDQWDTDVDRMAGELEINIAEIERLCREEKGAWDAVSARLNRFDTIESRINERAQLIAQRKTMICGSDDTKTTAQNATQAVKDYDEMLRMADEARSIRQQIERGSPPIAIDFSPFSGQLAVWKQQLKLMKVDEVEADSAFKKASNISAKAEQLLRPCPPPADFNRIAVQLQDEDLYRVTTAHASLQSRLTRLRQRLADYSEAPAPTLNDLLRRINESESFVTERIDRQSQSRRCLDEIPNRNALLDEGEAQVDRLKAPLRSARADLSEIRHCRDERKTANLGSGDKGADWSEGGYDTESAFDGVIEQIGTAAQNCDYKRALTLADDVLAQDPENRWVNQNYRQLQVWADHGERYQHFLEEAMRGLEQGNVKASLSALNKAMQNASTQCGQDRTVTSLRDQAQRIVDSEREEIIETARRESMLDARQRAEARARYQQREAERRRNAEQMHTILTGIINLSTSRRDASTSAPSNGSDDIVDHLVKENERKHGDLMKKWQQTNNTSIRHPTPTARPATTTEDNSWTRLHPDDYPSSSSSASAGSGSRDSVNSAPLPPAGAAGGILPPATGGYECSGPKDWCDEQRNLGW